jgi:carboxyl-terminal processing protease
MENFVKRFSDGELITADSTHFPDSLKYKTLVNKRIVYGGGGIMPDVFVSVDTSYNTPYFRRLYAKNVLNTFTLEYYDKNRSVLSSKYKSFNDFKQNFQFTSDDIKSFIAMGEAEGIKYDEEQYNKSKDEILLVLKGLVATNIWQTSEYFQIINQTDKVIDKALKVISDKKGYNTILGFN